MKIINKLYCKFAAHTHVDKSIGNPITFIKNNVNGTLNLLEALKNVILKKDLFIFPQMRFMVDFKDKPLI